MFRLIVKIPLGEQHCENSAPNKVGACCSWWFTVFLEVSVCACLDILGAEGAVVLLLCWQWMKRLRPRLGLTIQQQRFSLCSRSCVSLQTYIWNKGEFMSSDCRTHFTTKTVSLQNTQNNWWLKLYFEDYPMANVFFFFRCCCSSKRSNKSSVRRQ